MFDLLCIWEGYILMNTWLIHWVWPLLHNIRLKGQMFLMAETKMQVPILISLLGAYGILIWGEDSRKHQVQNIDLIHVHWKNNNSEEHRIYSFCYTSLVGKAVPERFYQIFWRMLTWLKTWNSLTVNEFDIPWKPSFGLCPWHILFYFYLNWYSKYLTCIPRLFSISCNGKFPD